MLSWKIRGVLVHCDSTLSNRSSRLLKALTSLLEPLERKNSVSKQSEHSSRPAAGNCSSGAIGGTGEEAESNAARPKPKQAPRRSLDPSEFGALNAAQQPRHTRLSWLDVRDPLHMRGESDTPAPLDPPAECALAPLLPL